MLARSIIINLSIVVGMSTVLGCASMPEDKAQEREVLGQAAGEIAGGYVDDADTSVVGLSMLFPNLTTCTGSLLAPNVVLTARHCVSEVTPMGMCDETFPPPISPDNIFMTTHTNMFDMPLLDYHAVREVVVLPDNHLCGGDQVIVILNELIADTEAKPLVPRVDEPLVKGEEYYAVGFGATSNSTADAGMRRRRDSLFIACIGEECQSTFIKPTEWQGDAGICQGDSGGPALDLKNRVIGVSSRGVFDCTDPTYGDVYDWGQWIKDTTVYAASLGGYDAPGWATGYPTDPVYSFPVGDSCQQPSDCASNACLSGYCTRLCNDLAFCPDGYTCNDLGFCQKVEQPPIDRASEQSSDCSVSQASNERTTLLPWFAGLALGTLMLRRRRGREDIDPSSDIAPAR